MPIPLSVQLYSLREQMKDGQHLPYIKRVAEVGYKGVECAGFYGMTAKAYRALIQDHGMTVTGHHAGLPEAGKEQAIIEEVRELGLDSLIVPWTPTEHWQSADSVKRFAAKSESAREKLAKGGVRLGYHNHDQEMKRIDGKTALELFTKACPKAVLEIDVYWASNFGAEDPAKVVSQFKDRAIFLHIKDGPLVKGQPHTAVGAGKVNTAALIKAADPAVTKWLVVELDHCATDMWTAIEDSYHYLIGNGLAAGAKPARAKRSG